MIRLEMRLCFSWVVEENRDSPLAFRTKVSPERATCMMKALRGEQVSWTGTHVRASAPWSRRRRASETKLFSLAVERAGVNTQNPRGFLSRFGRDENQPDVLALEL